MKALPISDKVFNTVANKFDSLGLGYVRRTGNSIRIKPYNTFMADDRNATIEYAIYLHESGYCWRRYVRCLYADGVYQLFRTCKNRKWNGEWYEWTPDTHYIWEHFATIEQAIDRFEQYAIRNAKNFYYIQ